MRTSSTSLWIPQKFMCRALIVQSVFYESFWRVQSHWLVFVVELFVFWQKNTNWHRYMLSGCVSFLLDISQSKSVVLDLCDSHRWGKKCVWVFSIVGMSCWCGWCTSICFLVYEKAVRNNDEYPNLSIDNEDHPDLWRMTLRGGSLFGMDWKSRSKHD